MPDSETSVAIRNIRFAYEPSRPVFNDLSWSVSKPGLYCVIGPSGCGKSTLFDLLLRLYPVDGGEIRINGCPVDEMPIRKLRKTIGIIHQDAYIIAGSLLDNIRFGDLGISEARIHQFMTKHGFHNLFPIPYDQFIPRGSRMLTAGMRRIISLVRTMLRDPQILLLDEVTANLDSYTEMLVLKFIRMLAQERICIMISHKPEDSKYADFVLDLTAV